MSTADDHMLPNAAGTGPTGSPAASHNTLRVRRMGIDTYREPVVYMRADCHVCRSEGFEAQARVLLAHAAHRIVATLNVVADERLIAVDQAGLSEPAWRMLGARDGDAVTVSHAAPLDSMSHVRAKVYGQRLDERQMTSIVHDVAAGRYADIHLATFITACAGSRLDEAETVALTRAMIGAGERLSWPDPPILDKHCVGGLPGNRTTLLVVPIVAACGQTMPKTSSRAITSPAGSADTMETLAPVDLDTAAMRRVVEREGGCIVWGGAVRLSPADDVLIRVERPLDLDSEGQLIASVLSKKAAAGSTHVVIDIPVGPTAKVRSEAAARFLSERLIAVGKAVGLQLRVALTDGRQPVGRGIGPALEARDVLAILNGRPEAPRDLRERALRLAAEALELSARVTPGAGYATARAALDDGRAWSKFQGICQAQGGMREPPTATHMHAVTTQRAGQVTAIDNRLLARVAKLAGAPKAPASGIDFLAPLGTRVERGQPLFIVHAEAPGELAYALEYLQGQKEIVEIAEIT